MKAVIVEIIGSSAAVLSEDGRISQIKNKSYSIGQEITMKNNSNYIKWAVSAAAAVMLFVTPAWAYLTPYSYVSLDVNPSFEFSINRFDRVLEVKAVNDDAEEVVEKISIEGLKNKEIQDAVKKVLNELKNQGYIVEGEESGVIVATSSKSEEKTEKLAATLKIAVNEEVNVKTKENGKSEKESKESEVSEVSEKESGIEVEIIGVSQEKVSEAKERGFTPGKINLVEKLKESQEDQENFKEEEWLHEPVKVIMKEIKKNNKQEKQEDFNYETEESHEIDGDVVAPNDDKNKNDVKSPSENKNNDDDHAGGKNINN